MRCGNRLDFKLPIASYLYPSESSILILHARHVVRLLSAPRAPAEVSEKVQGLMYSRQVGAHQCVHQQGDEAICVQRLF